MAFADTAMVIADVSAADGGYGRDDVDQTTHFRRAVASATCGPRRWYGFGRSMGFGRVTLKRPRQTAGGDGLREPLRAVKTLRFPSW